MTRNAAALFIMLTIPCAGCGSMCSERLSWEPPGGAPADAGGLYTWVDLGENDHIRVRHTLLETMVDPPSSTVHVYNKSAQEVSITCVGLAYVVEGQKLPVRKLSSWDPDSRSQPVTVCESRTVAGILKTINPVKADGRARIDFYYDFEDTRRNKHATMTLDLEYMLQGERFHFVKTLDLVKYSEKYNCIFGKGTRKHVLGSNDGLDDSLDSTRPQDTRAERTRRWVDGVLREQRGKETRDGASTGEQNEMRSTSIRQSD